MMNLYACDTKSLGDDSGSYSSPVTLSYHNVETKVESVVIKQHIELKEVQHADSNRFISFVRKAKDTLIQAKVLEKGK